MNGLKDVVMTEKRCEEVGTRVRECRRALGLSIARLALLSDTSPIAIKRLERGVAGEVAVVKLAAVLKVNPWWLVFGDRIGAGRGEARRVMDARAGARPASGSDRMRAAGAL